MSTEELKPCPFCGSADIEHDAWASLTAEGPGCNECGATAETDEAWNQRAAAPKLPAGQQGDFKLLTKHEILAEQRNMVNAGTYDALAFASHIEALTLRRSSASPAVDAESRLLKAVKFYATHYLQDEAEDVEDCTAGDEQHQAAKEVFAAIREAERATKGASNG